VIDFLVLVVVLEIGFFPKAFSSYQRIDLESEHTGGPHPTP
jgi:hypothetical protein